MERCGICAVSTLRMCFYACHLFACCCKFLSLNDILPILGGSDHSVLDTIAQLTEGRSDRDQPKQPPAKKKFLCMPNITDFWFIE